MCLLCYFYYLSGRCLLCPAKFWKFTGHIVLYIILFRQLWNSNGWPFAFFGPTKTAWFFASCAWWWWLLCMSGKVRAYENWTSFQACMRFLHFLQDFRQKPPKHSPQKHVRIVMTKALWHYLYIVCVLSLTTICPRG